MSKQTAASPQQGAKVFISYRREDSAGYAGWLFDRISSYFGGKVKVFMDLDSIAPGEDFITVIKNNVVSCDILVAVIGRHWLTVANEEGQRRLDNPEDFVRIEIATALNRGVRVIPVLVQGASMPQQGQLPKALVNLSRRNAIEISDARRNYDVNRLIETIADVLNQRPSHSGNEAKPDHLPQQGLISRLRSWQGVSVSILAIGVLLSLGIWHLVFNNSRDQNRNTAERNNTTASDHSNTSSENQGNNTGTPSSSRPPQETIPAAQRGIMVVRVNFGQSQWQGFFTSRGYIIAFGGEQLRDGDEVTVSWLEGGHNYNEVAQVVRVEDMVALLKLKNRDLLPHNAPIRLSVSLQRDEAIERLIGPGDSTPGRVLEVEARGMMGETGMLRTTRISFAGDAGAPVVDSQGKIVAMVISASPSETFSMPIEKIKLIFPEAF